MLFAGAAGTLWFVTPHGLERDLCRAVRGVDAEVGIAVVREGRVIASVGGDRPMPAMSTFKFPLALAAAARLDSLGLPLSAQLEVTGTICGPIRGRRCARRIRRADVSRLGSCCVTRWPKATTAPATV